jgi:hypothetical protein
MWDTGTNFPGLDVDIEDGGFADITIHQDEGETVASRYINLINGDDATCIVYIG